jgi:hypothetical protein
VKYLRASPARSRGGKPDRECEYNNAPAEVR